MLKIVWVLMLAGAAKGFSQDRSIKLNDNLMPPFRSLRFEEDYSFFRHDSIKSWYKQIKFSPLSADKKSYISYGGDVRFQYFYINNEQWGDAPNDKDGYMLSRVLLHADLHAGSNFRTFVQLQSSLSYSRIDPSPVDENQLDVHQAFADFRTDLSTLTSLTLRAGRQELSYGAQRLISVREGPNNRQSFDAVKAILVNDKFTADIFYSHYVAASKKVFDDAFNKNTRLCGGYAVIKNIPVIHNMDVYYLGLSKTEAVFDDGVGKENRNSIGTRVWNDASDWHYNIEGLYQFGKFSGKKISAWTVSAHTSYSFSHTKGTPDVGLKAELISGDRNADDLHLQTFNPLFPRGAYFGLAALIGPANLIDFHPYCTVHFGKGVVFGVDYDIFWRYSEHDGVYGANGALIYSGRNISSHYIGDQMAFNLEITTNKFLNLTAEFTWFDAGRFLQSAGAAKDILFMGVTAQLKF